MTELEIYKLECGTKDLVMDLIAAGIWKNGDNEYKLYSKYEPTTLLRIPVFDQKTRHFQEQQLFTITGAEYRRALVCAKCFAPVNYRKLDEEGKKRVNRLIFGQDERPPRGSDEYRTAFDRLKRIVNIIQGEPLAKVKQR